MKLRRTFFRLAVLGICVFCLVLASSTTFAAKRTSSHASWLWPVDGGRIGDGFGSGRGHTGVDILKSSGSNVYAAKDGRVIFSSYHGAYGNLIVIRHDNGYYTFYSHCSKRLAKAGKVVDKGDKIATVGSTGRASASHLHFEIRKGAKVSGYNNTSIFLLKAKNPLTRTYKA